MMHTCMMFIATTSVSKCECRPHVEATHADVMCNEGVQYVLECMRQPEVQCGTSHDKLTRWTLNPTI